MVPPLGGKGADYALDEVVGAELVAGDGGRVVLVGARHHGHNQTLDAAHAIRRMKPFCLAVRLI
jgi:bifunctional ADP-heptose synthase (sugar kinase/adenylyltransferase)